MTLHDGDGDIQNAPLYKVINEVSSLVEAVATSTSSEEISICISQFAKLFGLEYLCGISRPSSGGDQWHPTTFGVTPTGYEEIYIAERLYETDPLCQRVVQATLPFAWTMAEIEKQYRKKSARWIELNRDTGIPFGLVVPVHAPGMITNMSAIPTLTEKEFRRDSPYILPFFHMFGLALADAANRNVLKLSQDHTLPALTARERECLGWIAEGKTAWECAHILSISESTVIFHIENAKRKLGANNITQAVYLAVRSGIL